MSALDARCISVVAVGGAIAATVYVEPAATDDVDIFVAEIEGERLAIAGWLVQLLPPPTPLVEDALARAVELEVDGTLVPVFTQEHLAAIAVETGRLKDKLRVKQFLESQTFDHRSFSVLVEQFDLTSKLSSVQAFLQENQ